MTVIPNSNYNKAVALMEDGKYEEAIAAFEKMDGYKDSAEKIEECQTALKDIDYNAAVSLLNDGKIVDAYKGFVALDGYKDSVEKASEIFDQHKAEILKAIDPRDTIFFGAYEQDNNTSNGKEDIEWIVLAKENGKALVVSKYVLDSKEFNTNGADITWEKCNLRTWMNGTFLNTAFSADEQAKIATTNVTADKNPEHSTNPGKATKDKVFLLSITEAQKYFKNDELRKCAPTAYAKEQGAWTTDAYTVAGVEATCQWWLRSPGYDQSLVAIAYYDGSIYFRGGNSSYLSGVRPAMWIDLNK